MVLLEREFELAQLDGVVRDVEAGAGALVLISGPRGTGRSVLLRELGEVARTGGAEVLLASGALSERGFRFGVLSRLLEPLLFGPWAPGEQGVQPDLLAPLLSDAGGTGSAVPRELLHGLHALLAGRSAARMVALLVDDLQWADDASLRCLAYLVTRLNGMRVLIGAVFTDGAVRSRTQLAREFTGGAAHELRSRRLSLAASRTLVHERFGEGVEDEFALACHEVTAGNPRDLTSLLRRAESTRLAPVAASVPEIRSLGEADRRERLASVLGGNPAAADLAKAVVVLGERAHPRVAERLSGLDPAGHGQARQVLEDGWLSVEPQRIGLTDQDLVSVVEDSMSAAESESLHQRAATLLHGYGYEPEDVAAQLLLVNSRLERWAIDQLRVAADAARLRAAPETAARYLRRALMDTDPAGAPRAKLLTELAAVELGFDQRSAIRHITQAVPLLPTVLARAAVLARLPLAVASSAPAIVDLVRAVAGELGDPYERPAGPEREFILSLEARLRYAGIEDPVRQAAAVARLAALAEGWPSAASAAERELAVVLLQAATVTGRMSADRVAALGGAILEQEPASSLRVRSVLQFLPFTLVAADSLDGLGSWLEIAWEHARRRRDPDTEALIEAGRAVLLLGLGRPAEARNSAVRAFDLAGATPDSQVLPTIVVGVVAGQLGDAELADRVLALRPGTGGLGLFAVQRLLRGSLAARRGELDLALAQFLDCGRRMEQAGWSNSGVYSWRTSAAMVQHQLGNTGEARRLAEEEYEVAKAWGAPTALGRSLRVRGTVTGGEQSTELFRESVRVLRRSPNQLELGQSLIGLGARVEGTDRREAARLRREGQRLVGHGAAAWPAEEATDSAGAVGSSGQSSEQPALTRTEAQVARLAADGRTNQEIADELGVSRRAAEKHLTSSYRKLNIDGRADLENALRAYTG